MKYILPLLVFVTPLTAHTQDLCKWNQGSPAKLNYCEDTTCYFENISGSVTLIDIRNCRIGNKLKNHSYVCVKLIAKDSISNYMGEIYVNGQNFSHKMIREGYCE